MINRFARRGVREPAHRTGHRLAGRRRPRAHHWRARGTRSARAAEPSSVPMRPR